MRLIDADKLMQGLYAIRDRETGTPRMMANWFLSMIDDTPTVQPQGIDKDRLEHAIKLLEFCKQRHIDIATQLPHTAEIEAGKISCYEMAIKVVRENLQQPTSDGWIPVSEQPPKEPCVYTVEDYSPYTVAKYGEPQRKFLKTLPLGLEMYERIVAWKPVEPQPYKGSE